MPITLNGTTGITTDGLTTSSIIYDGSSSPALFQDENRIINGAFDFWQRGTSHSANNYGSADRWRHTITGGTVTMSRQSFALGDTLGSNSPVFFLRHSVSGQTLASHVAVVQQNIESVRSYAGQTITVLGWARRSSGAGNMAISFNQDFGTGGSPSTSVAGISPAIVTLTGSWTPFAVTATIPSVSGKTLGTNGNDFLTLNFWTSAGSDFNSQNGSLGLQTIGVDLWGIHIKVGTHTSTAVSLYRAPESGPELARCQRYYYQLPGALVSAVQPANTTGIAFPIQHPVTMRINPATSLNANLTNANYVAGSPSGVQWTMFASNIQFATKTGTVTIGLAPSSQDLSLLSTTVATFSVQINSISAPYSLGALDAEL